MKKIRPSVDYDKIYLTSFHRGEYPATLCELNSSLVLSTIVKDKTKQQHQKWSKTLRVKLRITDEIPAGSTRTFYSNSSKDNV